MAVPPYLLAYVFTEFFDYSGTANNFLRNLLNAESDIVFFPNIRTIYGAIAVFSFTLYPYVYMVARVAFMNISPSLIEASKLLGKNSISKLTFFILLTLRGTTGYPYFNASVAGTLAVIAFILKNFAKKKGKKNR